MAHGKGGPADGAVVLKVHNVMVERFQCTCSGMPSGAMTNGLIFNSILLVVKGQGNECERCVLESWDGGSSGIVTAAFEEELYVMEAEGGRKGVFAPCAVLARGLALIGGVHIEEEENGEGANLVRQRGSMTPTLANICATDQ
eukprot:572190-Ditylum_brightwellii.AAC.1